MYYIDILLQDCSNSIANAMELLQSSTKPSTCSRDTGLILTVVGELTIHPNAYNCTLIEISSWQKLHHFCSNSLYRK